ncbi:hypothetical protein LJR129_005043 [Acidovorax sp. LjRoot129]
MILVATEFNVAISRRVSSATSTLTGTTPDLGLVSVSLESEMKEYCFASQVREGDVLCFSNPASNVRIERISEVHGAGTVGLHANDDTWSTFYKPTDRVRVIASDRCSSEATNDA